MKKTFPANKGTSNYGALTILSKQINHDLGDRSSRTVSRRTADGFRKSFKLNLMSGDDAEDIVHIMMILAPALLRQKSDFSKAIGILLFAGLVGCYAEGK